MKKVRITESELISLIENAVKQKLTKEKNVQRISTSNLTLTHPTKKVVKLKESDVLNMINKMFSENKNLTEQEGKGCSESEGGSGCIKKRGSGWVILNNKKGGVWRKCDSKKHCEEILDAFHAAK